MIIFYMITAAIAITFSARRTHPAVELIKTLDKTLHKCRFVNDALHIFLENLAEFNKSFNIIGWSFPIQRTHREIVVFSAMYSKLLFEIIE